MMPRATLSSLFRVCLVLFGWAKVDELYANATQTKGISQVLFVRMIGTGPEDIPKHDHPKIINKFFNESNPISVSSVYRASSLDALTFVPMPDNSTLELVNGVMDVHIDITTNGTDQAIVRDAAHAKLTAMLGEALPGGNDLVMFCCPHNCADFGVKAGYATLGGWNSVYRNNYCLDLHTVIHEIGHNLGLNHGNQQDDWMGPRCYRRRQNGFNGPNSYFLGWYEDRHLDVSPLEELYWEGDIIGMADYQRNVTGPPVIVKILGNATIDFYVSLNRNKGFSIDTCMEDGLVLVHYKKHPSTKSAITRGVNMTLHEGESLVESAWDKRPLNIVVNSINNSTEPWSANIKIFATCFTDSDCDNNEPCDGEETCGGDGACIAGTPIFCEAPSASPTKFCLGSPPIELENTVQVGPSGGVYNTAADSGIAFDIEVDHDIFIDAMFLQLQKNVNHTVTIYTKQGSYVGFEDSISEWTEVVVGVTMQRGDIELNPIFIDGGTTQAFFVLAEGGSLAHVKYDSNTNFGDVVVSDDNVRMLAGIRTSGSLGSETKAAVYSMYGNLYYHACDEKPSVTPSISLLPSATQSPSMSVIPSITPSTTLSPSVSVIPSLDPTHTCHGNELSTFDHSGGGGGRGISAPVSAVFDIEITKSLYIENLWLKLKANIDHVVTIYTKDGSYVDHENEETEWTKIVDTVTMSEGDIPDDIFVPFFVAEGSTIAFYVHVSVGGSLVLQKGDSTITFGDENSADDAISLKYGLRVNGAFGDSASTSPHAMKGKFHYKLCDKEVVSSAEPSSNPSTSNLPSIKPSASPPTPGVSDAPSSMPSNLPSLLPSSKPSPTPPTPALSDAPSSMLSELPSLQPTTSSSPSGEATHTCPANVPSTFRYDRGGSRAIKAPVSGVFDVEVSKDVYFENLAIKLKKGKNHVVTVYMKEGSHVGHEDDEAAWTKIVDEVTMTLGDIPSDDTFTPFFVAGGSTIAFYLHVTSSEGGKLSLLKGGGATSVGDEYEADDVISLKYGLRVNGAFGDSALPLPYAVKGRIHYRLCDDTDISSDDEASEENNVEVQIPMAVELGGVSAADVPTDDAGLVEFANAIKPVLTEISGGDVIINAINGAAVNGDLSLKMINRNGVNVDFVVALNIECSSEADCDSVINSASNLADDIVGQLSDSISDGYFTEALIESATELGVNALTSVTVDVSTLSSEEPIVEVTVSGPTTAPTEASTSTFMAVIQIILDFLNSLLELFSK